MFFLEWIRCALLSSESSDFVLELFISSFEFLCDGEESSLDTIKLQSFDSSDFLSWKIQVQLGMKERYIFYIVQYDLESCDKDVDELQ